MIQTYSRQPSRRKRKDHQWEIDDNARRGMKYKHKDEAHQLYNQLIIDESGVRDRFL
ncbi:hypothetical protein [Exiguobacterium qingdaonense]|uniref:hypothetical protein n=1 Tax=Exiguobacterium qingdaonense TaxID=2751251 RepID=UPI001BE8114D|nr:hypothetical protein [Exiguobacterium qingdaonense]